MMVKGRSPSPRGFFAAIVLFSTMIHPTCMPGSKAKIDIHMRERIKSINTYVAYYGSNAPNGIVQKLGLSDLAIVQPDTLTQSYLHDTKIRPLVVAYLSVGEITKHDPLFNTAKKKKWIFGKNESWDSYYVNVSIKEWQEVIRSRARELINRGYDGVFLDTVDTVDAKAEPAVAKNLLPGMIELIHNLRKAFPNAVIVQNRGFSVIDNVVDDVDALMFEDLTTTYDHKKKSYETIIPDQNLLDLAVRVSKKLPVLVLDYARPDNPKEACRAFQFARSYCFISTVSVGELDDLPDYKLEECPAKLCSPPFK
jgi:endo-alpha-1,4-polygalactosaminidase (GH114 family)